MTISIRNIKAQRSIIPASQNVKIDEIELEFGLYLAVSFHSISSPSLTSSSISEKSGCDSCASSPTSSPRINCTLWAGGVTKHLCDKAYINIADLKIAFKNRDNAKVCIYRKDIHLSEHIYQILYNEI